jgi:hypothetical protein
MKRLLCVIAALLAAAGAFAQFDTFFEDFQSASEDFAADVANSLPFNASIGLNWSDAYIGQLLDVPPHFGVGVALGATTIPSDSVTSMLDTLDVTIPADISQYLQYGVPIPAYTVEGRIGGFFLPFDIGVKVGYIPPGTLESWGIPVDVNYLLVGADVRFSLLKEDVILPAVSVGAGYTFMHGSVAVPGVLGGAVTVQNFEIPDGGGGSTTHTLGFTDPSVNFEWNANVIDLKAQVSKSLLIFTPYLGLGASYGFSSAGGGLESSLLIDGTEPTQAEIDDYNELLEAAHQDVVLSDEGFLVQTDANGWSFRTFGGVSFNLFVVRLDLTGMYNFTSGDFGGSLGVRVQL